MKNQSLIARIIGILTLIFCLSYSTDAFAQRKAAKAHHAKRVHHRKAVKKHAAHHHYRHLPRRGAVVISVHRSAVVITFRGIRFHYHAGIFYKPKGTAYVIVRPPIRVRISVLPVGHRRIVIGPRVYFYYYGTFYVKAADKDEYEVVDAPVGAQVDAIPDGYETKNINDEKYYVLNDVYYTPKDTDDGETLYEVVESPE